MNCVYKFPFPITDKARVFLPKGAQFLRFDFQRGESFIWCLVDPSQDDEVREFRVVGTGHEFPEADDYEYRQTFFMQDGALVFHIFERKEVPHV